MSFPPDARLVDYDGNRRAGMVLLRSLARGLITVVRQTTDDIQIDPMFGIVAIMLEPRKFSLPWHPTRSCSQNSVGSVCASPSISILMFPAPSLLFVSYI